MTNPERPSSSSGPTGMPWTWNPHGKLQSIEAGMFLRAADSAWSTMFASVISLWLCSCILGFRAIICLTSLLFRIYKEKNIVWFCISLPLFVLRTYLKATVTFPLGCIGVFFRHFGNYGFLQIPTLKRNFTANVNRHTRSVREDEDAKIFIDWYEDSYPYMALFGAYDTLYTIEQLLAWDRMNIANWSVYDYFLAILSDIYDRIRFYFLMTYCYFLSLDFESENRAAKERALANATKQYMLVLGYDGNPPEIKLVEEDTVDSSRITEVVEENVDDGDESAETETETDPDEGAPLIIGSPKKKGKGKKSKTRSKSRGREVGLLVKKNNTDGKVKKKPIKDKLKEKMFKQTK